MKKHSVLMLAIVIVVSFIFKVTVFSSENHNTDNKKLVLIVADYICFEDLEPYDTLLEKSYLALINNRQNGKPSAYKSKGAIGSGKRLEVPSDLLDAEGRVYSGISGLKRLNRDSGFESFIGYIGNVVHANMEKTCFIGNADSSTPNRSSILISMDRYGTVDYGITEDITIADSSYPFYVRTDYNKLAELYKQFLPACSFMVIETGDMERLEKNRANMSSEHYNSKKQQIVTQISGFIMNMILKADNPPTIILLSTYPSKQSYAEGDRLTPILIYDKGNSGVLASSGTKREGIVINTELADYILYKLGMQQSCSISEIKKDDAFDLIMKLNGKLLAVSLLRLPILTVYGIFVIISLLICFAALMNPIFFKLGGGVPIKVLIASSLIGPLVLLLLPAANIAKPLPYILIFFMITILAAVVVTMNKRHILYGITLICLLTILVLSLDVFLGSPLSKQSVLGYDPIIGARFYGIGNELAGVFIGSSIILLSCLKEINHKMIKRGYVILYYSICACILGMPFLGANLGGVLSALAGYYFSLLLHFDCKLRFRYVIILPAIFISFVLAIVILDHLNSGSSVSHIGLFFKDIGQNGLAVLFSTFSRKLAMNVRLIRYTIWTKVLLCIIVIMIIIYFKPVGVVKKVFKKRPFLKTGWVSVAAASIFGLLLNDSGIVLAAMAMIYVGFTLLLLCFDLMMDIPG